jgi:hypothetical protein
MSLFILELNNLCPNLIDISGRLSVLVVTKIWLSSSIDCDEILFFRGHLSIYFVEELDQFDTILRIIFIGGLFTYVN